MKFQDGISLSIQTVKTRSLRSFLTVLGMSVGIAAVFFLVSLGYGLQRVVLSQITSSDPLLSLDVASQSDLLKINSEVIRDISAIPDVQKVAPLVVAPVQMEFDGITVDVSAQVIDPLYFSLQGIELSVGKLFNDGEKGIIISSSLLKILNKAPEDILEMPVKISLFAENVGATSTAPQIIADEFRIFGVVNDESNLYIFAPLAGFPDFQPASYQLVKVRVSESDKLENVRTALANKGLLVSALLDTINQANKIFSIIQIILGVFGTVALIVAAIGMFNTMVISLLERTQYIGIMKSIGATNADILGLFLLESLSMGIIGGAGGITIGFVGAKIFNFLVDILARGAGAKPVELFYFPLWFIGLILSFSAMVGLVVGFFPARRASKLNALASLRYK